MSVTSLCSVLPFYSVNDEDFRNCVFVNKKHITHNDFNGLSEETRLNDSIHILDSDLDEQNTIDCKYYLEEEFKKSIESNSVQFSAIHFNSRSMGKNFEQISDYLTSLSHNFSAIGLTETWTLG